jgi:hypothetical protein
LTQWTSESQGMEVLRRLQEAPDFVELVNKVPSTPQGNPNTDAKMRYTVAVATCFSSSESVDRVTVLVKLPDT